MKKIIEVLQYGANDIRFKTDFDVEKDPQSVLDVALLATMSMMTSLWGGNETSVVAIIRALAIADLAASVNPDKMLEEMGKAAAGIAKSIQEAKEQFEKSGGRITTFAPGIQPGKTKS
ncbi:MAG: hypothetical protein J5771_07045 [Bacteroidales bacterium]|nr:hypothetical protein [Bacteroidales bacterium]